MNFNDMALESTPENDYKHHTVGQLGVYNGRDGLKFYVIASVDKTKSYGLKCHLRASPVLRVEARKATREMSFWEFKPITEQSYVDFHTKFIQSMAIASKEFLATKKKTKKKLHWQAKIGLTCENQGSKILSKIQLAVVPYEDGEAVGEIPLDYRVEGKNTYQKDFTVYREGDKLKADWCYWGNNNKLAAKWAKHLLGHAPTQVETVMFDNVTELNDFLSEKGLDIVKGW